MVNALAFSLPWVKNIEKWLNGYKELCFSQMIPPLKNKSTLLFCCSLALSFSKMDNDSQQSIFTYWTILIFEFCYNKCRFSWSVFGNYFHCRSIFQLINISRILLLFFLLSLLLFPCLENERKKNGKCILIEVEHFNWKLNHPISMCTQLIWYAIHTHTTHEIQIDCVLQMHTQIFNQY